MGVTQIVTLYFVPTRGKWMEKTKIITSRMGKTDKKDSGMDKDNEKVLRTEVGTGTDKAKERNSRQEARASTDKDEGVGVQAGVEAIPDTSAALNDALRMVNPFARSSVISWSPTRGRRRGSIGETEEKFKRPQLQLQKADKKGIKHSVNKEKIVSGGDRRQEGNRTSSATSNTKTDSEEEEFTIIESEGNEKFNGSFAEPDGVKRKRKARWSTKVGCSDRTNAMGTLMEQSDKLEEFSRKNKNVHKETKTMATDRRVYKGGVMGVITPPPP